MELKPVSDTAGAVKSVADVLKEIVISVRSWIAGGNVRKMKAAIEAAENYIHTNEAEIGEPTKQRLLEKFKKQFFKYN